MSISLLEVSNNISTWAWDSPQMLHRQRHPRGPSELLKMIKMHLPLPENHNLPEALPMMLYLAQVSQVMGQKTQTECFRRLVDKLDKRGTGHNMGAMYWRLNDIWEGCSWSSVEVSGSWKLQMYYAINFFATVLVSPWQDDNGDVVVELVSDSLKNFEGEMIVQIYRMDKMTPVFKEVIRVESEFLTSKEVFRINKTLLNNMNCGRIAVSRSVNPCVVYTTLKGTPDNFLFLQYQNEKVAFKNPHLEIKNVTEIGDGKTIKFELLSAAIAPFVFLTVGGDQRGYFSENGFVLVKSSKEMMYYSENGITKQRFIEEVKVMSLFDIT